MGQFNLASKEEKTFLEYAKELEEEGYVEEILYEPFSFVLSDPVDRLRKHIYTPDFVLVWNKCAEGLFYRPYGTPKPTYLPIGQSTPDGNIVSYIEVKGSHDFKNMERLSKLNIKWTHQMYNLYINIVKPHHEKGLLSKTFTPQKVIEDVVTRGARKGKFRYKWNPVKLNDYVQNIS